jgi:catechol 2,3-dioxygenase-like lactoylglutathione lyase family enzyme
MTALAQTGFTVRDLDRSLVFYRDVLGMEVVFEQQKRDGYLAEIVGYPGAHVRMAHQFDGGGHRIELFEYLEPPSRGDPGEPRDVGITHVCLAVDDIDAIFGRVTASGAEPIISPPVLVDTGANVGGRGVYVRDPDGIIVELFEPRSKEP